MIDRAALLADLQRLLRTLEADLLERSDGMPEVQASLEGEYQRAREAQRTAQSYEEWRSDYTTQVAAAWVLSCVFVRFLEDNRLIDPPRIAGPGERLARARDEHEMYFSAHPTETDREYLLAVFDELAELPGTRDVFGPHNAVRELPNWLSGDAAGELLRFFQRIEADTGTLVHDFTDPDWDTRFLGDLYQDLSEAARKKYALLQTPEFVEEFILDRTLDPAIEEFGLQPASPAGERGAEGPSENLFRMIDPACGSGHFLLGSFRRLLDRWQRKEPGTNVRELTQRALDSVHGVDLNPYAVAIARFRLLVAALRSCDVGRLADAPAFRIHLACGDSLLHGTASDQLVFGFDPLAHVYQSEDLPELRRILKAGHYHAVVANPPYIPVKDKALNKAYRDRYATCYRAYSLAVPFMERIFGLAVSSGYTGQITSNSFMKRVYGSRLVEDFLPRVDLTHVIDTAFASIPGHTTPTVILLGRQRKPIAGVVRTAMGIRRESTTPTDPSMGLVWRATVTQLDTVDSENDFVTVSDVRRENFYRHPWSLGGGGAAELKASLDTAGVRQLKDVVADMGYGAVTREDDVFLIGRRAALRAGIAPSYIQTFVEGDRVRDWTIAEPRDAIWPYNDRTLEGEPSLGVIRLLWAWRTQLSQRIAYGLTQIERGQEWYTYSMFFTARFKVEKPLVYAEISQVPHFALSRHKCVFKETAPLIVLPSNAADDTYIGLAGVLNSALAAFWIAQVFQPKGGSGINQGVYEESWEQYFAFSATGLKAFPLSAQYPLVIARQLDEMAGLLAEVKPGATIRANVAEHNAEVLAERHFQWEAIRQQMISLQEELDWQCYRLYGLTEEELTLDTLTPDPSPASGRGEDKHTPPAIELGQRAFEIVMARKMAAAELETTWFERHGSTPITEIPEHWPDDYRRLVERRIALIESDRNIGLIEQPEYKRRWNTEPWESQLEWALRSWLLDRLETCFDFDGRMNDQSNPTAQLDVALVSTGRLAQVARQDGDFLQVGALYRDDPAFDVQRLVAELVEAQSVPLLPVLRYKPSGLRKRAGWEKTWELQRREDAIDARTKLPPDDPEHLDEAAAQDVKRREVGDVQVPPKYKSSDFLPGPYWRLRGKLDVPKERWVSFPHCEGEDGTLVIAWAGYDHLQLAKATSAYFVEVQERLGGRDDPRLVPLLACLVELVPWIKQWHNEPDPDYGGTRMGDYFEGFIQEEARQMGKTPAEIQAWEPPRRRPRRRRKTSK